MGIIEKIKVLEQAKSFIYAKTGLDTYEVDCLTIPEMADYLNEIKEQEQEAGKLIIELAKIDQEPTALIRTMSDIGCIRLFNDHENTLLFRNFVGDGINRIYVIEDTEDTDGLRFLATLTGEWYISGLDTENEKEARIKGVYDIYTDKNFNFFFKKVKQNGNKKL